MNHAKDFMTEFSKISESHVLSVEEQEMVEGGACDGVSCKSGCLQTKKKNSEIEVGDITIKDSNDQVIKQP